MTSKRFLAAAAVLALLLAGCGKSDKKSADKTTTTAASSGSTTTAAGGSGDTSGNAVEIKNFSFKPDALKVKAGTKVTFTNEDSADHTASSTKGPGSFDSGHLAKGKAFSYTFAKKGTYKYHCDIHSYMTGTVDVS